jgi:sortase A
MQIRRVELALWTIGALLLLAFVGILGWQELERRQQIDEFLSAQRTLPVLAPIRQQAPPQKLAAVAKRAVAATAASVATHVPDGAAIAILRIPAIKLVVPVNHGTGRSELFHGAGLVAGSALPGRDGNVSIAAHRDSFFRGLRNVEVGDVVELDSTEFKSLYRVTGTKVVEPTDVQVLADVGEPVLTLITCYPFHFVGKAPQRFIVRAAAVDIRK